jgi:hypothetical protein
VIERVAFRSIVPGQRPANDASAMTILRQDGDDDYQPAVRVSERPRAKAGVARSRLRGSSDRHEAAMAVDPPERRHRGDREQHIHHRDRGSGAQIEEAVDLVVDERRQHLEFAAQDRRHAEIPIALMNTISIAAAMAGSTSGSVIVPRMRAREAPVHACRLLDVPVRPGERALNDQEDVGKIGERERENHAWRTVDRRQRPAGIRVHPLRDRAVLSEQDDPRVSADERRRDEGHDASLPK